MSIVGLTNSGETAGGGRWFYTELVDELVLLPFGMRLWCHDDRAPDCRVYWGSHGCDLVRGHDGPCCCECGWEWDLGFDEKYVRCGYAPREDSEGVLNVGARPYYGWPTGFFGEDRTTQQRIETLCANCRYAVRSPRQWWRGRVLRCVPYGWRRARCRILGHRLQSDRVCRICWQWI